MLPSLLWIDDDGPRRFRYEEAILKRQWQVTWASSVHQAAQHLAEYDFRAILLDQMLPPATNITADIWGGCVLLWWLKGLGIPDAVPNPAIYVTLASITPRESNRAAHLCVVTAFDDAAVLNELRSALPDVPIEAKPIAIKKLQLFAQSAIAEPL